MNAYCQTAWSSTIDQQKSTDWMNVSQESAPNKHWGGKFPATLWICDPTSSGHGGHPMLSKSDGGCLPVLWNWAVRSHLLTFGKMLLYSRLWQVCSHMPCGGPHGNGRGPRRVNNDHPGLDWSTSDCETWQADCETWRTDFHKLRSHMKAIWTYLDAIWKSLEATSMFSSDEMTSSSSDTACLPQIHGPWLRGLSQAPKHKTTRGLPTCSTRPMTVPGRAEWLPQALTSGWIK